MGHSLIFHAGATIKGGKRTPVDVAFFPDAHSAQIAYIVKNAIPGPFEATFRLRHSAAMVNGHKAAGFEPITNGTAQECKEACGTHLEALLDAGTVTAEVSHGN